MLQFENVTQSSELRALTTQVPEGFGRSRVRSVGEKQSDHQ